MSEQALAWTFPGGKFVTNKETLGAVDDHSFVVPTGKRWIFLPMFYIERDTSASLNIGIYDPDDLLIDQVVTEIVAGTSAIRFYTVGAVARDRDLFNTLFSGGLVLAAGWYIKITWGATQTSPVVLWVVLEIDI